MPDFIPFNKIFKDNEELSSAQKVIEGDIWHGDGPVSRRVEEHLSRWLNSRHVFLTTSCTHALEMAMMALNIGRGDEVILPGFTFVSTANAIRMQGGIPVFAEVRASDLTLDPEDVARKITPATKAIIPIHYAGISADFEGIFAAISNGAGERKIAIVEDAAQAVGAWWNGRALGTIGDIGCFSFHDTKNFTCGEGGAFLTQDDHMAEQAELIREKGTNRSAFLRGEVDKYTWVSRGSSYIPSDLLAGILEAQLHKKDRILKMRKQVWDTYYKRLAEAENRGWITLPVIPPYAESNYHIFHFHTSRPADRDPLLRALRDAGIGATFHYVPLHNSPYARKYLTEPCPLPQTDLLAGTLIRLPLYPDLAGSCSNVADRVFDVISKYYLS
ncbi:dTDP-4-amino-4,6-dideoxygalactose transaminase [Balneolales bacterium ANBcel1]|nr:dTDP-4-amino-4,6-dideoxygalactose transaminase [Balneolales bacterium ANBcel1]